MNDWLLTALLSVPAWWLAFKFLAWDKRRQDARMESIRDRLDLPPTSDKARSARVSPVDGRN